MTCRAAFSCCKAIIQNKISYILKYLPIIEQELISTARSLAKTLRPWSSMGQLLYENCHFHSLHNRMMRLHWGAWIGFNWLKPRTVGGLLWARQWTFGCNEKTKHSLISRWSDRLLAADQRQGQTSKVRLVYHQTAPLGTTKAVRRCEPTSALTALLLRPAACAHFGLWFVRRCSGNRISLTYRLQEGLWFG